MKLLFLIPLLAAALTLGGCSTTANESTTAGSAAATVDNPSGIQAGASVTSANNPVGTTVGSINGAAIVLSEPASATGTVSAKFTNSLNFDLQETGQIAKDLVTDVSAGAVAYNDAQAALAGAQQAMGGHGISLKNIGTYALAGSNAVNTSGLANAIATVTNDVSSQVSQGLTPSQISDNLTAAQVSLPASTP